MGLCAHLGSPKCGKGIEGNATSAFFSLTHGGGYLQADLCGVSTMQRSLCKQTPGARPTARHNVFEQFRRPDRKGSILAARVTLEQRSCPESRKTLSAKRLRTIGGYFCMCSQSVLFASMDQPRQRTNGSVREYVKSPGPVVPANVVGA